jgi:hypothetical protein
MWILNAL